VATGRVCFRYSADGTLLVYAPGTLRADTRELVLVDNEGSETPVAAPPRLYEAPAVAPDGARIALMADGDIWVWDEDRGTLTRLTFEKELEISPKWSSDGARISYVTNLGSVQSRASDGTDEPQLVVDELAIPGSITEDGRLVYSTLEGDIGVAALDGSSEPEILIGTDFTEARPSVSPDGRWLAYQSDETGFAEIYVRPFPDVTSGRWQVSTGGGQDPKWAPDGRTLYYRLGGASELMSVVIEDGDRFLAGTPERLFRLDDYYTSGTPVLSRYDVAPDGRFVFMKPVALDSNEPERETGDLVVVQNWLEGLKRHEARD
jgi:Tol biopolymer transport system component